MSTRTTMLGVPALLLLFGGSAVPSLDASAATRVVPAATRVAFVAAAAMGPVATPAEAARQAEPVKYYIVRDPGNNQREFLFDIAARTLGNGNRYREIFDLNEGRLQPDGQRMTDPAVLRPGWILLLPADAAGPDVRIGPMPTFAAPAGDGDASSDTSPEAALRGAVLIGVAAALVVALVRLRRGTRIRLTWLRSLASATGTLRSGTTGTPMLSRIQRPPTERPPTERSPIERPPTERRPVAGERWPRERGRLDQATTGSAPGGGPTGAVTAVIARPPAGESVTPWWEAAMPSAVGLPPDALSAFLETTVSTRANRVSVRLVGVRGTSGTPFAWVGPSDTRPATASVVDLGAGSGGTLFVDLAQSPDVVSLVGAPDAIGRQASSIARQLGRAGVPVTVVGDPPGLADAGRDRVASLEDAVERTGGPLRAVFLGPPEQDEVALVHRLVAQHQPRTLVVVMGDGPQSRWTISVSDTTASGRPPSGDGPL